MRHNTRQPGQPISARAENERHRLDLSRIAAGPGVRLTQSGDRLVISADAGRARGGGGLAIAWVTELPDIPTDEETTVIVFWATSTQKEGGTGDGQLWTASTGDTRWYPLYRFTDEGGTV